MNYFEFTANFCASGLIFFCAKFQRFTANFKHFVWLKSACEIRRLKNSNASDDCRFGF